MVQGCPNVPRYLRLPYLTYWNIQCSKLVCYAKAIISIVYKINMTCCRLDRISQYRIYIINNLGYISCFLIHAMQTHSSFLD